MHTRKFVETVSRASCQRQKTDEPDYKLLMKERKEQSKE